MKTKIVIIFVVLVLFCVNSSAHIVYRIYLNNTYDPETYYIVAGPGDTVVMYKPPIAQHNIIWLTPDYQYIYNKDSVFVTYALQGNWYFSSTEVGKDVYIYFIPVGIGQDGKTDIPFTIYPNPANDECTILANAMNFEIQFIDMFGQVFLTGRNQKKIDIHALQAGTYIVRMIVNDNIYYQRIIIQ